MSEIDRIEHHLTNLWGLSMEIWRGWKGKGYWCTAIESTRTDAGGGSSTGKQEWGIPGVSLAF